MKSISDAARLIPPLTDLLWLPLLALATILIALLLGDARMGWFCCFGNDAGE